MKKTVFRRLLSIALIAVMTMALLAGCKKTDDGNKDKWEESYKKAKDFISKLNRTEKVSLLFGTENMRFLNPDKTDPSE